MEEPVTEEITVTTEEDFDTSNVRGARRSGGLPGGKFISRVSTTTVKRTPAPPQRPADYAGRGTARSAPTTRPRMPPMAAHSTAVHSLSFPRDTVGSQFDPNLSPIPKSTPRVGAQGSPLPCGMRCADLPSETAGSRFLLNQAGVTESQASNTPRRSPKRESLMEWFDRTVEKELRKRRQGSLNIGENLVNLESPSNLPTNTTKGNRSGTALLAEASTSGIDLSSRLPTAQETELLEAVEKLAKAEAMCAFEGAVKAAELAAAAAPPEYAEEAAAASAQGYQAELTGVVKHQFSGIKPVEVIGYVGITRPKKPKKPE